MKECIQFFNERVIQKLMDVKYGFYKEPTAFAEFITGAKAAFNEMLVCYIRETLEEMNEMLREDPNRIHTWVVEHKADERELITSAGSFRFKRTLFHNKKTGENVYLLDQLLELESHERLTEDAKAAILEEAVQTSYRRGGETVCEGDVVSKETVKTLIHNLKFPEKLKVPEVKRTVDYLYLDADEDHVSLQFQSERGDLETDKNGRKKNCHLQKLVYVYEDIIPEAPKSKRHKLVNPFYFSQDYGESNQEFWDRIGRFLKEHYNLEAVKKIYLNADGGGWIQSGKRRIVGMVPVLDEFHLQKYLLKMTAHLLDSADEVRNDLTNLIRNGTKEDFIELSSRVIWTVNPEEKARLKRVTESRDYILSNWSAARARLLGKEAIRACSAEGHVSHVLSSRMSSRPMGWSRRGACKMGQLRCYYWNKGNLLELVRFQEKELPMAAGTEGLTLSSSAVRSSEQNSYGQIGKYYEAIQCSISNEAKKYAYLSAGIRWL